MKLKLRIDSDDLWMVVVFAIFLLYVVAILVVNLSTFASEGRISGFNPLPAFSKEYIASTLGFYLIAIIAIINNNLLLSFIIILPFVFYFTFVL